MTSVLSSTNVLPHSQRLRLIRSVKKLGDLLTETSQLVDAAAPVPHSRAVSPSRNTWSTGPTSRFEAETVSDEPRAHFLIPPSPSTSSPHTRSFFSLRLPKSLSGLPGDRSPLSPTFSLSLNSPSTPIIDPETLKERKLAKVAQTLGENVPAELVFPPPAPTRKGRRRASTTSVPPDYMCTASDINKRAVAAAGAVVVGRRRHARELSRTLQHAASSTSLRGAPRPPATDAEPFSYASLVAVSSFEAFDGRVSSAVGTPLEFSPASNEAAMHRKELGWSGEWSGSVRNMEDVVRGLRDLRLK
ncbi:hypothetical protein B0H12DRAFT_1141188 [Mycena haematopus]|nr:hypothetical protein B0H12DRAFT_1141188 [Mycena haematopus]